MLSSKLILSNPPFFKETPSTTFNHIDAMKCMHVIDINLSAYASDDEIPQSFKIFLGRHNGYSKFQYNIICFNPLWKCINQKFVGQSKSGISIRFTSLISQNMLFSCWDL